MARRRTRKDGHGPTNRGARNTRTGEPAKDVSQPDPFWEEAKNYLLARIIAAIPDHLLGDELKTLKASLPQDWTE